SNVTGQMMDGAPSADYWRKHVRQAVRFSDSIETLRGQGYDVFVEIGPKPTLMSMGQQCWPGEAQPASWLPSLREGRDDWQVMLDSLGALYIQGASVDWAGLDKDYPSGRRRVVLPTYPFQRARYWLAPPQAQKKAAPSARAGRPGLHPLLGQRLRSSLIKETVFEAELAADLPSYLNDHRIFEAVVFPGTGYLEMALAAAASLGSGPHTLESVSIHSALTLPEDQSRVVQLILDSVENGQASFKILSLDGEAWTLHATGNVRTGQGLPAPKKISLTEISGQELAPDEYYQALRETGIEYGPTFRGIKQLWRREGEAWGEIQLPTEAGDVSSYHLHPALLDSCFQLLGAMLEGQTSDVYLPVGMDSLQVVDRAGAHVWARASLRPVGGAKEALTGDLELFDESGQLVAELHGLRLKRATREALRGALQKRFDDWLYEVAWRAKALSES
ncbi:MAG: polyketide synthase dehydratase domain-containing protein, partial [Chloroflexota bacterium]